jgi:hypothetical protein
LGHIYRKLAIGTGKIPFVGSSLPGNGMNVLTNGKKHLNENLLGLKEKDL